MKKNTTENEKKICNFHPKVKSLVRRFYDENTEPQIITSIVLKFDDGNVSEAITLPILNIENYDWYAHDIRCRYSTSPTTAKRKIANLIREQAAVLYDSAKSEYVIAREGLHLIAGKVVYGTGDGYICNPQDYNALNDFVVKPTSHNLDIDPNISVETAICEMFELISLFPNSG